ncbi:MAG: DUF169 domain-containing protein [Candidatus Hydrothermarchaeales archaeon]
MDKDKLIRSHLGIKYNLVGVKILKKGSGAKQDPAKKPQKRIRFCQAVREAANGKEVDIVLDDLACPNAEVTLGFDEPIYVDIQPRVNPANTEVVSVAPADKMSDPDVILTIMNPKQTMETASLLDGIEAKFTGNLAVCGEATAKPYMDKSSNVTFLCGGARTFGDYKESELIFGAPPEEYEKLAEKIEALSKSCGALCGCRTSDISPRIVNTFKKLGFEKGIDYFFGKVDGHNVRIYLNKDLQGRFKYITIHLPLKEEVKPKAGSSMVVKKRGTWTDVAVTFGIGEAIDINTGKGLKEAVEDIMVQATGGQ